MAYFMYLWWYFIQSLGILHNMRAAGHISGCSGPVAQTQTVLSDLHHEFIEILTIV